LLLLVQQVRVDLLWLSQQKQSLELVRFYLEDKTLPLVVLQPMELLELQEQLLQTKR
jgi:hypothetical protein